MANPFVHLQLQTGDLDQARQFYSRLFDWHLADVPMGESTYTTFEVGQGTGGGMMTNPTPGTPSHWLAYVDVADVEDISEKAAALGGAVLQPKTEVPGAGAFAVVADPTGAVVGLWQTPLSA